jgi:hypothetical protein
MTEEERPLTPAMKKAVRNGRHSQNLKPQTRHALEERGLIGIAPSGRWHWTPRGLAAVRQHRQVGE